MADLIRIQVLITKAEADRFNAYCHKKGHKKSTLIARLVREHLDREAFNPQPDLFNRETRNVWPHDRRADHGLPGQAAGGQRHQGRPDR